MNQLHGEPAILIHILGTLTAVWATGVCVAALSPLGLPTTARGLRAVLTPGVLLGAATMAAAVASWA